MRLALATSGVSSSSLFVVGVAGMVIGRVGSYGRLVVGTSMLDGPTDNDNLVSSERWNED